jgi:Ca2+/H+ antiporter, TMEM165/GDT1 family
VFGFVTSFKSVLLEGLEVAFIVITFGVASGTNKADGIWGATIGVLLSFVVVVILGIVIRSPLSKIPEKFDFFCGDWRVFWGVTLTLGFVILLEHSSDNNVQSAAIFLYAIPAVFIFLKGIITDYIKI